MTSSLALAPGAAPGGFAWDRFQQTIFADFAMGEGHTVVIACAGSGKTTTLIAGLDCFPSWGTILLTAFSKPIERELKARAPRHVSVRTNHSLGLAALRQHLSSVDLDEMKGWRIARDVLRAYAPTRRTRDIDLKEQSSRLRELTSLAKSCLVRSTDDIQVLAYQYGLEDADFPAEELAPLVVSCLTAATANPKRVDYDDMVYLPIKLGLTPAPFDFVLVDECQDLNAAQLHLTAAACKGRFIAIGDPRQAIFQFRGADSEAIPRIIQNLGAKVLPLSVTYRCPIAVINYVKQHVPDIDHLEARPNAPQGQVADRSLNELLGPFGARPGDFVLSRLNAPLMPICLHFLRHGIPAMVLGRDIGSGLVDLVRKSSAHSTHDLLRWLAAYQNKEYDRLVAADQLDRYTQIADQADALRALAEGTQSTQDVILAIQTIFSDDKPTGAIVCSTVHKAKGLERDRVWLLQDTFFLWDGEAETNMYYVACTRSRSDLFLVHGGIPTARMIRALVDDT